MVTEVTVPKWPVLQDAGHVLKMLSEPPKGRVIVGVPDTTVVVEEEEEEEEEEKEERIVVPA